MTKFYKGFVAILLSTSMFAVSSTAHAQDNEALPDEQQSPVQDDPPEVMTIDEAAQLLRVEPAALARLASDGAVPARRLEENWRFSRAALLGWLAGYRQGTAAAAEGGTSRHFAQAAPFANLPPLSAQASSSIVGRGMTGTLQDTAEELSDDPAEPIGTAPKGRTASEVFLRDQRVLLNKNELTVDFGLVYARTDNLVQVDTGSGPTLGLVESDTFGGVLVGRYSLGGDTELFASTSYSDQNVGIVANGQSISQASRNDLGDIGIGMRRTILHEGSGQPDVILSIEGGIPTRTGSYSLAGGVTLVKSFDPAVLFGSVDYRHTFSRDFTDFTRLEPRDRIDAQIGYAFALNDTIILTTALSGSFNMATSFAEADLRQNETYNLLMGFTARISPNLFVQPSVSYRLNGPGNGVIFGLNFPLTFGP